MIVRTGASRLAKRVVQVGIYALASILARPGNDVVYSVTTTEGNAIEVLRALVRLDGRRVAYLFDAEDAVSDRGWSHRLGVPTGQLAILRRRSLRGIWRLIRAERVFFTHAIWWGIPVPRRSVYVNLWHGDGPKTTVHEGSAPKGISADYVVSGTRVWGEVKKQAFGSRSGELLVVGNPRIDQYERPISGAQLRSLGLDATSRLVLWAPTYRYASVPGGPRWADASPDQNIYDLMAASGLPEMLREQGAQLVIKPHPFDDAVGKVPGAILVRDGDLLRAGIEPYQLLGATDVLVTDYSSIWTDFLALDRPVVFFCPDLAEYRSGRGLPSDFEQLLPGRMVHLVSDLGEALLAEARGVRQLRAEVVAQLGCVTSTGATQRLLAAIAQRG